MSVFTTKNIDDRVKEAMFKKIVSLNRGVGVDIKNQGNFFDDSNKLQNTLEPQDTTNPVGFHLARSVFVRVQADVVSEDKLETAESSDILVEQLAGYMEGNITDNTVKQGLRPISFNKSAFTNDKNFIWKGQSGITGLQVQQQSFYVKTITINWECPDPKEFEDRWLTKFLKHGRFMVVEFGWGIDQDEVSSVLGDGEDRETIQKLIDIKKSRNKAYAGSYQLETGIVQNYNYEMNSNGGYSGTITLVSRGHNLLKQPVSSGDSKTNSPILYSKKSEFNYKRDSSNKGKDKKKFIEAEATFKEVIDNLDKVVEEYTGGFGEDGRIAVVTGEEGTGDAFSGRDFRFTQNSKSKIGALRVYRPGTYPLDTKSFVTWGWFEDFILNSFFRVEGKAGGDGKKLIFQEFRSVEENEEGTLVNIKCNNTITLDSLGIDSIILPGQIDRENNLEKTIEEIEKLRNTYSSAENSDKVKEALFQYRALRAFKNTVNNYFEPFGNPDENFGYVRNMVFNIEYIKSKFKDVTNIQEGIKNFWDSVGHDYDNYFDFFIQTDYDNNGRVAIGDYYYQNQVEKKVETNDPNKEDTTDSYAEQGTIAENAFVFGLNSKNSIVKQFSLDLKLSAEAATIATYGNYKQSKKGSLTAASATYDLSTERFVQLFSNQEKKEEDTPGPEDADEFGGFTDPDSLINKYAPTPDSESDKVKKTIDELSIATEQFGKGLGVEKYTGEVSELSKDFGIEFSEIGDIKENVESIFEKIEEEAGEVDDDGLSEEAKTELKRINQEAKYNLKGILKELPAQEHLERINTSPIDTEKSNYQMLNVTIPIELSMTIDGVGGLDPGDVFLVDYLPKMYRKYAYFQIFTINHSISTSGWDTTITAKMKLNNKRMIKDGLIVLVKEDPPQETNTEPLLTSEVLSGGGGGGGAG